jgi:putative ABC transport system permease protein
VAVLALAAKSLRNRAFSSALTVVSIALSVTLLLGVERIREQSRASFASTISGTDLIVGARASPVQLLLYSVFRIGNPTNNIRWESYRDVAALPQVAWSVPIALGDSHRGFRVMGTTRGYFEHLRFAGQRRLALREGRWFEEDVDVVLGAEVARHLGYGLGDELVVAHGAGDVSFIEHSDKPFRVSGILQASGTPVDRTLHVSLRGLDRLHEDMSVAGDPHGHDPLLEGLHGAGDGPPRARARVSRERHGEHHAPVDTPDHDHAPVDPDDHGHAHGAVPGEVVAQGSGDEHHPRGAGGAAGGAHHEHGADAHTPSGAVSAVLIGLTSRPAAVFLQREIAEYEEEPLTAILPGVAMQELWGIVGVLEGALLAISGLVVAVGLSGMLIALTTSLEGRRREMAVLRSVGASPAQVLGLIVGEAAVITALAITLGVALLYTLMALGQPVAQARLGLYLQPGWPGAVEWGLLALVAAVGLLVGLIPGLRVYRYSLADGMSVRT